MKPLRVGEDIVPVGEFKARVSSFLKQVRSEGRPVVVTQNGRPAGVLVPVEDYDDMVYRERVLAAIREGIEDLDAGRFIEDEELWRQLEEEFGPIPPDEP